MCIEDHFIEYKDFYKEQNPNKKTILAKLFVEISAFANASGGEVIVGKEDETGVENEQPDCIYKWLTNDQLTPSINRLSDNLIVFSSRRDGNLIRIKVAESDDVISAICDTTGINKGDCFIRENHESVKARGEALKRLIEKKSLSADQKLKALRKIVHYKMNNNMNNANQMNIFDSLFVSLESPDEYINVVFDSFVKNEFVFGYKLPLSKYSTMQMHLEICAIKSENSLPLIQSNRETFDRMMRSEHIRESFFLAHINEVLCSPQLKAYIFEHKDIIGGP